MRSDDITEPVFDDSEQDTFLETLMRFSSMINRLAPQEIDYRGEEEPKTPVTLEFDKVVLGYEREFAVGSKRTPDGQEAAPCTNSRCFINNQALAMAITTLRDVLRSMKQHSAIWHRNQPQQETPVRDAWQNGNEQGYSNRQIKDMMEKAFAHWRKEQEEFAKEMLKREDEREEALYNESIESAVQGLKWEAVGGVPPRLRRSISDIRSSLKEAIMTDGKDSVWAGHWEQKVDRGIQCDFDVYRNDDDIVVDPVDASEDEASGDRARDASGGRPINSTATKGMSSTWDHRPNEQDRDRDARTQESIRSYVGDGRDEMSDDRIRMLEDEGVVFDLNHVDRNMMDEIPPFVDEASLAGRWAYEISDGEEEDWPLHEIDADIEGIQRWAEDTSLQAAPMDAIAELQYKIADLQHKNSELQRDLDELEGQKTFWLQQESVLGEQLPDHHDCIERLAADGGQLLSGEPAGKASKVWMIDPLRSCLNANSSAWIHMLVYVISKILKVLLPLTAVPADLARKWEQQVRSHRIRLLDKLKPALEMRGVMSRSYQNMAYVAQYVGIMATMQIYFSLQQERDVWFQANGLTRRHFLAYSIQHPHRWRAAEPGQGCPRRMGDDFEGLSAFLSQFLGVWMVHVLDWVAMVLTSSGSWAAALQRGRRYRDSATASWRAACETSGGLLAARWNAVGGLLERSTRGAREARDGVVEQSDAILGVGV